MMTGALGGLGESGRQHTKGIRAWVPWRDHEIPRMEKRLASMAAIAAPCAMRVSNPIFLRHTIRVRHERRRDVDLRKIVHGGLTVTQWKGKTAPRAPGRRQMASPSPIDGK